MQSMRISMVVQVILVALTLGICLGTIVPKLPDLVAVRAASSAPQLATPAAYASTGTVASGTGNQVVANASSANLSGGADLNTSGPSLQVQVRAEVQAAGNANAEAQALGPGNTQAKANTLGPGSSQAVAYTTDPINGEFAPAQAPVDPANATLNNPTKTIPASFANTPSVVVREAIINLRSGPSTSHNVIGMATQGQSFTPLARTVDGSWWKVCCYDQQHVWLAGQLADMRGTLDNIEVVAAAPPPVVAVAPPPTNTPAPPPPAPAAVAVNPSQSYEFGLVEKNQFAEGVTPRVYLYIAQGAEGLGGYTLQVKKNNVYLPVNVDTFNGPPAFTWPLPIDRQRFHNLKVEFPGVEPAGTWEIQVVEDSTQRAVAAPVTFNLTPNDARQEMYISLRR